MFRMNCQKKRFLASLLVFSMLFTMHGSLLQVLQAAPMQLCADSSKPGSFLDELKGTEEPVESPAGDDVVQNPAMSTASETPAVASSTPQMSWIENLFWIGLKSFGPAAVGFIATPIITALFQTGGLLADSFSGPCGTIAAVILTGVAVGLLSGATSAGINYLYEKRMNNFRQPPKDDARILRDCIVSGVGDGVLQGVFSAIPLLGGPLAGLAGGALKAIPIGPAIESLKLVKPVAQALEFCAKPAIQAAWTTAKPFVVAGAKLATQYFVSEVAGKTAAGATQNFLNQHLVKIDDQKNAVRSELQSTWSQYQASGDPALKARCDELTGKLNDLEAESYTTDDLKKDVIQSAWSSLLIGLAGGAGAEALGSNKAVGDISKKIFGNAKYGKQIAKFVVDLPVYFLEGSGNAAIDIGLIDQEIKALTAEKARYPAGDWHQAVIDNRIDTLRSTRAQIDVLKSGKTAMVSGAAMDLGMLGGEVIGDKAREVVLPVVNDYLKKHPNLGRESYEKVARTVKKINEKTGAVLEEIYTRIGETFEGESGYVGLLKTTWEGLKTRTSEAVSVLKLANADQLKTLLAQAVESGKKVYSKAGTAVFQKTIGQLNVNVLIQDGKLIDFCFGKPSVGDSILSTFQTVPAGMPDL